MVRIASFAPHYAEYATRMALALADDHEVLLLLDQNNRRNELQAPLFEAARRATTLFEFRTDTRITRRVARLTVALRILLFRPDVVHVQEQPDHLTAIVMTIVSRFVPIVLTVHDPKPHTGRDAAYAMRRDKYRRRIRQSARAYHVHGPYCVGLLKDAAVPDRPVVSTLHGVILTPPEQEGRPPVGRRILFFGRMEEYKGLDVLLESVRELNGRGVGFDVVLAGRGPELDRLAPVIAALPNVTVVNRYLTPDDAVAEFQRATVVVIPYREATQSGVVAAAFANGLPVVASQVGGLVDVVRDDMNGLFVPPGSAPHLADALQRVLDEPGLRARLAEGARHTAATDLNWSTIGQQLTAAYAGTARP